MAWGWGDGGGDGVGVGGWSSGMVWMRVARGGMGKGRWEWKRRGREEWVSGCGIERGRGGGG